MSTNQIETLLFIHFKCSIMQSSPAITLHSLYKEMISSTKEKGNVIYYNGFESANMMYPELEENVKKIADKLIDLQAENVVIGCFIVPTVSLPAILLGVLQASASFAVIDAHDTGTYLANMLRFVSIRIFIVDDSFIQKSEYKFDENWLMLDEIKIAKCSVKLYEYQLCKPKPTNPISNVAYVIQTSGTTGSPKVVQVPHQCICPNIVHLRSIYSVSSSDVILLASPLTFDPSIIDIFLAMSTGASLILIPDHIKCMNKILQEIILNFGVTILQITPSLLQTLEKEFLLQKMLGKDTKLRILALGGERCPSADRLRMIKNPENNTRIFNLYGLTEVSCWATYNEIKFENTLGQSDISLGVPFTDTSLSVFDDAGTIVTEGSGQLFIGGSKRSCIINDESSTVYNGVMRPTGDWVYLTKDGEMFFEGRKDNVIKYHGKKFFTRHIDQMLEKMPEVSCHLTFFQEEKHQVYIFIVLNPCLSRTEDDFRNIVHQKMKSSGKKFPAFKVIFVPEIPITSHGKADHLKLLQFTRLQLKRKETEINFSTETLETLVISLWKEYTKKGDIQGSDNFILCGGDSIAAVQFASEVQRKTSLLCPILVDLLLNATFTEILKVLRRELLKFSGPIDKLSAFNCIKDCETDISTHLSVGDRSVNIGLTACFRKSRRGISSVHFCQRCSCSFSSQSLNNNGGTISLKVSYKFNTGKCVDASPCLVRFFHSDLLVCYIGSHSGQFKAMDIEHGTVLWENQLPDRIESSADLSHCGQFVLVGCYDHKLYCFCAMTGKTHWTFSTQAEIKSSVIVSPRNVAFVGSHDHYLYAINVQDGNGLWSIKIGEGSIFSSVAYFSNFVCAATLDGIISALDENSSQVLWSYNYGKPFFSSPLVLSNSVFIGCVDGFLLRFDFSGNLVSKYHTDGPIFSSATPLTSAFNSSCQNNSEKGKRIVFGSHDCNVHCCSLEGGRLWKYQCNSSVYAIPTTFVMLGGHQYVVGCSVKGSVFILDAENGHEVCTYQCPGEVFSTPEVLDDCLVVGCRDNYVYVFKIMGLT